MPRVLFLKRAKVFLTDDAAKVLPLARNTNGELHNNVPDWVTKTSTYKQGIADESILDCTPTVPSKPKTKAELRAELQAKLDELGEDENADDGEKEEVKAEGVTDPKAEDVEDPKAAKKAAAKKAKAVGLQAVEQGACRVGTWNSYPNFNAWLDNTWNSGMELWQASCGFGVVGLYYGTNPPFALDDVLAVNPKFFGAATPILGVGFTIGSNQVTIPASVAVGLAPGQFVQSPNVLPEGTTITSLSTASGNTTITFSQAALVTQLNAVFNAYEQPVVPAFVLQMYINLANASLVAAQWEEQWYVAMGLFVAHYATLYAKSDAQTVISTLTSLLHGEVPAGSLPGNTFTLSSAPPNGALQGLFINGVFQPPSSYTLNGTTLTTNATLVATDTIYANWFIQSSVQQTVVETPAQVAASGIAFGIMTSKSVGDVSTSYQVLSVLEDWGAWNLTSYGQLLATMAKALGSGPLLVW